MLNRCVQTTPTKPNIFENKENVEAVLKQCLNKFNCVSTCFQQLSACFNIAEMSVQKIPTFRSTNVGQMLKPMLKPILKPFKQAFNEKSQD